MDIVGLLSSLNKIALIAFLITLGFLIYELILLRKMGKAKAKPEVPQFQEGSELLLSDKRLIEGEGQNQIKKNKLALVVLTALLMFFGSITWIGYVSLKSSTAKNNQPAPSPTIYRVIAKNNPSPTPEPIPTTPSPSPTVIEQLPKTGYLNNLLILFSVAGLVIFFSFLF